MFRYFNSDIPGSGIFWEKDWGFINSESYSVHTECIIYGCIEFCNYDEIQLRLMKHGASGHGAGNTTTEFQERGIEVICWSPFSPDQNSIEKVQYIMKDYRQDNFLENMI